MHARRSLAAAGCLTVFGLLLASCAPAVAPTPTAKPSAPAPTKAPEAAPTAKPAAPTAKPAAPAATPKPAAGQARYGGILTAGIGGDPPSLDIHREESGFNLSITAATYNGLAKPDPQAWPDLKVVPDLATSWELSPDGKVHTFHLAKGAKFHDGAPLTAEDVKFSLDRIRDPQVGLVKSPRRQQLVAITNIDTPDDQTVKITLKYPQASFLALMASPWFAVMPKRVALEKKNDMTNTVVGTGAFRFKDYATGVGWELVKNPDYFVKGRPYLDGVKAYIIRDQFARFAALRTGNILWWGPFPYMSVAQSKVVEQTLSDKVSLQWAFHPAWYGIIFNVTRPPWNDVRLRQAVSMTLDRKKMLEIGLEGAGVVAMAAQPPGEWSLPEEELMKVPGYAKPDIEGARKLVAEAGFAGGLKTDSLIWALRLQQTLGVLFKDAVAPLGITVNLAEAETAVYLDSLFRKAFVTSAGSSSIIPSDPDMFLSEWYVTGSGRNYSGYSNPQYDELYAKQSQTLDTAERRKIVYEMQRILLREVPVALVFWPKVPYAWWKEVRGFAPPANYLYSFGYQETWLAK